jgi:sugar O-acyltransferase (sialic acid O-acetyltransferase NeuD family)
LKRLGIIGAGDLGVQLAQLARKTGQYDPVVFFDDSRAPGTLVAGIPVLGPLTALGETTAAQPFDELIVAIGYRHLAFRQHVFDQLRARYRFATLVDPTAVTDPTCVIAEGAIVYAGCILDMGADIGCNALLNVGCVIAHDSKVGAGCFLSPSVTLAGFVRLEPSVSLGIGTTVIDNVHIASGVRTGAGAVVIANLDVPGLYVGVPARLKKAAISS